MKEKTKDTQKLIVTRAMQNSHGLRIIFSECA